MWNSLLDLKDYSSPVNYCDAANYCETISKYKQQKKKKKLCT